MHMSLRIQSRGLLLLSVHASLYLVSALGEHEVHDKHVVKCGRRLRQSALQLNPLDPVSATTADLADDPTGRGHLLVRVLYFRDAS